MSSTTSTNPSSPVHNTSLTIEQTFTFPHTIDRVWFVIRDVTLLCLLKPDVHFPLIPKDGKNVWNIHAEFLGKNDSHEEYTGKCVKVKNFPQYKKIVWDINTTTNKFLRLKYQLFQVGDEGETVLLYKLKFRKNEDYIEFKSKSKELIEKEFYELMEKINTTLNESSMNLFQYEGGVIKGSMEDIWDILTHLSKLKKIAPLIIMDGEDENKEFPPKVGDINKITYNNHKCYYLSKTLIYEKRKNWNKWVLGFEAFYGEPKIPFQKVIITLTKINSEECHISFFHDFKESASKNVLSRLSFEKKYTLKCINDYLSKRNNIEI